MNRISSLLVVAAVAGSIYFVKNIKISVVGAEARDLSSRSTGAPDESTEPESEKMNSSISTKTNREDLNVPPPEVDPMQMLVSLIKSRNLCEFIDYAQAHNIGKKQQLKALSLSLGDERFSELDVFYDSNIDQFDQYSTIEAKSFLIGKTRHVFDKAIFTGVSEYSKGLKEDDQLALQQIETLAARDPSNLFFAMFRNDIYHHYSNVDQEIQNSLYEKVMNTTRYENPVQTMVRDLYFMARANVVQFFLAQSIFFDQSVAVDDDFISRSIWNYYDENMRFHINGLLGKSLEGVTSSAKVMAYEPGVYNAYRNSLHYTEYETTPELGVFEASKSQPVYGADELKLSFKGGCEPAKVADLEIKLRAL